MLLIICIIFMVIGLIFIWLKQITNYWTKRSVPCDRNLIYFRYKRHIAYEIQDLYKHWKDSGNAFIGSFILFQPVVLLLDLDLIKNVFISDFNTFPNRGFYHNLKDDPLSGNLFRLEGNEWKAVREKLTPTFSSGKMKYMFPTVVKVAHTFVEVLEKTIKYSSEVEMKDLCARFTTDVVGTVAFGLECNSLNDPQNEFRTVGDKAFTSLHPILETLFARYQSLARYFHLKVYSQMFNKFYTNIISQNIEYRTKNNIRRPDFLDILIELRNNKQNGKFGLSLEEIVGQSFVFFVGGFETSSSTMTYCLYELAKNPDIQNKARQVILKALKEHNNELSYECLQDMSYLNQIFMGKSIKLFLQFLCKIFLIWFSIK